MKEIDGFEDLVLRGMIVLKRVLKKRHGRAFFRLRTGSNGVL